ncbi:hypothetical protein X727_17990 [Mesorhizobium sp. L103C119B0]|nr:hypothetical protein X727_17990 [Mesorhizobium sp. L103C119B0]
MAGRNRDRARVGRFAEVPAAGRRRVQHDIVQHHVAAALRQHGAKHAFGQG